MDFVFYPRNCKSHDLIDLKLREFTHSEAGQMNVHFNC
ncbi:DUF1016 family protein [Segetibacter sp. 3557_3]|nr:DUF1016 family protein [Segetibacter sp. 3557_3]